MDEIPKDFRPDPIGSRDYVIKVITSVVPKADFSDPTWGLFRGDGFSIEFSVGKDDVVDSFALHVRGGDDAIGLIADLLDNFDVEVGAVDPQSDTGIFDRATAVESLRKWREYRDRFVG
jgi:hypothetical protein